MSEKAEKSRKYIPAIVYNAKFQALVKSKGGKVTQVTNEELDFLRQAEADKDVEDEDDADFLDNLDDEGPKPQLGKKQATFYRPRDPRKKKGDKRKGQTSWKPQGTDESPGKSIARLNVVAHDLESVGTNSTAVQSMKTVYEEVKEPQSLAAKWKTVFFPSQKKKEPNNKLDDELKPFIDKHEAALHRVTTEEAKRIRLRQSRQRKRMERCTYGFLVFIVFGRLFTTLKMVYEYESFFFILENLKVQGKLNCLEAYDDSSTIWDIVCFLYFLACCILPILTKKDLTGICVVWMFAQMVLTSTRFFLLQRYIFNSEFYTWSDWWYGLTVVDVLSFTVVMIRYYYWANPSMERDRYSNTMLGDYLVNEYIQFMVQSSFIRKKNAVQRATAFQIMTVVRKLKEKYTSSGKGPSNSAIAKEVKSAIHALQDWKKFPALRIIHSFEVKEKIMKEKLKLRRQRIRDMKDRFHKIMKESKEAALKMKKSKANKVVLNPKGQAIGVDAVSKSASQAKTLSAAGGSRRSSSEGSRATYVKKRAKLLQQNKDKPNK